MRLVCFNCNGLRSRMHQLTALVERHAPEVIGLQETKVADDEFPLAEVQALGYEVAFHGQKGHYGVALLSRSAPLQVMRGLPGDPDDAQRRLIGIRIPCGDRTLTVLNGYFPQGENRSHPVKFPGKERFYAGITDYLRTQFSPDEPLVLMGDFNIAPQDIDIGIGDSNRKRWLKEGHCSFLPEERTWFAELAGWGLIDSWRHLNPTRDDRYSWFDYRSRGFEQQPPRGLRIDMIMASRALAPAIRDAGIDYDARAMEKPSDHCPLWLDIA
ncbi:MAG: exodeoxyribonuclease III [Pseudomonadota bacterium]